MPGPRCQATATSDIFAYMLVHHLIISPGQTGYSILARCVMFSDQTNDSRDSLMDRRILGVHDEQDHVL